MFRKVTSGQGPALLSHVTDRALKTFIELCVEQNPELRPSAAELLDHPFLTFSDPKKDRVTVATCYVVSKKTLFFIFFNFFLFFFIFFLCVFSVANKKIRHIANKMHPKCTNTHTHKKNKHTQINMLVYDPTGSVACNLGVIREKTEVIVPLALKARNNYSTKTDQSQNIKLTPPWEMVGAASSKKN